MSNYQIMWILIGIVCAIIMVGAGIAVFQKFWYGLWPWQEYQDDPRPEPAEIKDAGYYFTRALTAPLERMHTDAGPVTLSPDEFELEYHRVNNPELYRNDWFSNRFFELLYWRDAYQIDQNVWMESMRQEASQLDMELAA